MCIATVCLNFCILRQIRFLMFNQSAVFRAGGGGGGGVGREECELLRYEIQMHYVIVL